MRAGEAPCRLFVYLARSAPIGVVLRRGPTDWARLSLWRTDTDAVEHGQWIKGRVYERRCDVSADGRLFAAFVRQSGRRQRERGTADTWIALSRPPHFTAQAVWFVGGTYHTGAFFPGDDRLWLGFSGDTPPDIGQTPERLRIAAPRSIPYVDGTAEWTERTVHFNRLLRDGWTILENEPYSTLWQRRHPQDAITLRMTHVFDDFRNFGGPYAVEYSVTTAAGLSHNVGRATWADWDHRGRLVVARDGQLGVWNQAPGFQVIEDFNGQEPESRPGPLDPAS